MGQFKKNVFTMKEMFFCFVASIGNTFSNELCVWSLLDCGSKCENASIRFQLFANLCLLGSIGSTF